MKKSILLLLLCIVCALISCSKVKYKEKNCEVTTLSCMKASSVVNSESIDYACDSVSVADVQGNESGQDIADVKVDETSVNGPEKKDVKVENRVIKKKIIKDGRMGLQVTDLEVAKKQIDTLVKSLGGYYANENLRNSDNESGYDLTIRIPVVNFDKFVNYAETGKGKVLYKEISARDVTEEFVDLETRLNSKRNALARYNEIMKKANAMKDIVELENAIRTLQEEIETTEGKLRYLNDCVNYSTLTMSISTQKDFTYTPVKRDSFWEKFKESVTEGWYGLVDFVLGIFLLWPFWLVVVALIILILRWLKRRKARKQKKLNS